MNQISILLLLFVTLISMSIPFRVPSIDDKDTEEGENDVELITTDCEALDTNKTGCISHIETYTEGNKYSCCFIETIDKEDYDSYCIPNVGTIIEGEELDLNIVTMTCHEDYVQSLEKVPTNEDEEDSAISLQYSLLTTLCLILLLI